MTVELDIKRIKEKALLLVDSEEDFSLLFDQSLYLDLIENVEDYIAEGLASHYNSCYE
jgi:hypothetical protein